MEFEIDDSELVRDYISGDEKALEVLINRHNQRISSFIYSKVLDRDITEDIFQDTFIKVIKTLKKGSYSEEGKFLPWVMRIAHNLIIDHFRMNKRMPKFEGSYDFNIFSVIGDDKLNTEKQIIKDQIDSDLGSLIEELPDDQKEVLLMRIYKDMSF
ncbi:MAG: sigma-70 family RNA polymerase sigma factor, partial [Eudoraea sp.]|nr:sigma-70 family RNA polymerase sigma factor [Eudoraea sp.]